IPSSSINVIHYILKESAKERTDFLQKLGKRIFRGPLVIGNNGNGNGHAYQQEVIAADPHAGKPQHWSTNKEEVMLFCLGGVKQVGRSCFIVVTPESKVMLDCGI